MFFQLQETLAVKFGAVMILIIIVSLWLIEMPKITQNSIWAMGTLILAKMSCFSASYTEITNFVQGYIENEVNFNRDGSCSSTCSDYRIAEQHGCANSTMCHINYLDKNKTRCDGQIRSCQFIESDMTLCPNVMQSNSTSFFLKTTDSN